MVDETEFLLEEAIDSMERRAARVERRTDDALASFAEMFEKNEARRERERASVATLTEKLSEIETRLGDNDQSPIKGALARLEARLETIGRRTVAEAAVKQNVQALGSEPGEEGADPIRRLEEKLNAVLDAVSTRPTPQTPPLAEAPRPSPLPRPAKHRNVSVAWAMRSPKSPTASVISTTRMRVPSLWRRVTASGPLPTRCPVSIKPHRIRRC